MPRVLVPLADGCEEMEAVIILDTLRRAEWDVVSAGLHPGPVRASRGVVLVPDASWDTLDIDSFDMLVLPGGARGTSNLAGDVRILDALRRFHRSGKLVAAVCAGPLVLQAAGILEGKKVTCHPSAADDLKAAARLPDRVVIDGNLITSQGPGTSFEFALAIVERVDGSGKANRIAHAMVLRS